MAKIEIKVEKIYDYLSSPEKYEMGNLLIENKYFNLNDLYDSLNHFDKVKLTDKLTDDDYFDDDDELEPEYDKQDKFNIALLSLLDKSYMLTKSECEWLINIANKYKYYE